VFSPFGPGTAAFADGLTTGRSAVRALDSAAWGTTDKEAALVPDFDARVVLGKKGTRGMNRLSGLAVATVGLLKDSVEPGPDTGVVLGTTTGSAQTMMETIRTALLAELPYHVDPATTPYGVMNGAAGQCAIWYGYKGPNATLAAGRPTGFAALNYARRLLLTGRARSVLAGAAEEYSRARSWLEFHSLDVGASRPVLGEGCAMFAVTSEPAAGAPPLAEVLGVKFGVRGQRSWEAAVRTSIRRVLDQAGVTPEDVSSTSASGMTAAPAEAEDAALAEFAAYRLPALPDIIGETHAASSAFQVAAVLALAERDPGAVGDVTLLTSIDPPTGTVAVTLLRMHRTERGLGDIPGYL
jgi:3-oxoacyl-[acyl-carrier-protein] synthase II